MLSDLNKNKNITTFSDLVDKVVKERNIPYEQAEEICRLSIEYIKELVEDKDTLTILIPWLGNLYYSERIGEVYKARSLNYTDRTKERKQKLYSFLDHRTKLIEKGEEENNIKKSFHRKKPLLYKFKNIYKKLYDGKIVKAGATVGYRELWSKFSDIQNKIQNGEKDYL